MTLDVRTRAIVATYSYFFTYTLTTLMPAVFTYTSAILYDAIRDLELCCIAYIVLQNFPLSSNCCAYICDPIQQCDDRLQSSERMSHFWGTTLQW